MAFETQYNIVKVNELRAITLAAGDDEIIINDLDSSPLETKKITVVDLANSIKDYILPIAGEGTDGVLGGIKVGDGLTINPITGVLSNDHRNLYQLNDVFLNNPSATQVLTFDGSKWVAADAAGVGGVIAGEGLSGGGYGGDVVIDVNPGPGIEIKNDAVAVKLAKGLVFTPNQAIQFFPADASLTFIGQGVSVNLSYGLTLGPTGIQFNEGRGLTYSGLDVTVDIGRGLRFEGNKVEANIGKGLKFNGSTIESTSNVTVSSSPPVTNNEGDLWWDTDDGNLYIYYENAGTPYWVPATGAISDMDGFQSTLNTLISRVSALEAV